MDLEGRYPRGALLRLTYDIGSNEHRMTKVAAKIGTETQPMH
jgi:hypothetical protein